RRGVLARERPERAARVGGPARPCRTSPRSGLAWPGAAPGAARPLAHAAGRVLAAAARGGSRGERPRRASQMSQASAARDTANFPCPQEQVEVASPFRPITGHNWGNDLLVQQTPEREARGDSSGGR